MLEHTLSTAYAIIITTTIWIAAIGITLYYPLRCIYNLYFHPLRTFPGPKLAAIGSYLEFYYDVVKDGTYLWEIEKMHRKYGKGELLFPVSPPRSPTIRSSECLYSRKGPIVRINARELHIYDPHFYKDIYAGSSRRTDKDPETVAAYAVSRASLATVDHDLHRVRRGFLSPYFAKRSVVKLEPVIQERINKLCMRLEESMHQEQVVDLDAGFAALTADIVTYYFYGSSYDYLGSKGFKFAMRDAIVGLIGFYHLTRFLPALANTIKRLPIPIIRLLHSGAADLLSFQAEIKQTVLDSLDDETSVKSKSVIFGALKDPDVPAEEKTIDQFVDEGTAVIFAGTETTARALSVIMFHLLHNKLLLKELRRELLTLTPVKDHAYQLSELEALPYLVSLSDNFSGTYPSS